MATPNHNNSGFHSAPRVQCLRKAALECGDHPTTFFKWMNDPNNIYVSTNLKKYHQDADIRHTKWGHSNLSYKLFTKQINKDEFMKQYADYIIKDKWADLDTLKNKVLGCWCDVDDPHCHARVLQSLYRKKMNDKFFSKTRGQPST